MDVQLAKETSERLLLVQGHLLIAEEDDLMLDQRVVNLLESLIAERFGQINTRDLRPDDGAQWGDEYAFVGLRSTSRRRTFKDIERFVVERTVHHRRISTCRSHDGANDK